MSLEDIYTKFNIDHPEDFTGHSLSVSDVVVLHQDGENTSHYVDSVGYREIPEFTKELSVSAEISTEKDAVREETAEIPAEAEAEHTAAENTMAEPDNDKVSYYVIEDLSTWAENSPEKSRLEGNIHTYDELIPIDYDELTEKAEQEAKHGIENRIRKEAEERKTVADFKARTEELFHGINGQTQEDIELSVYAYLQSKIDEYGINIELVDAAVSGSRCRGLEEAASDLDVVVEYRGRESEDDLFNAFNEDGFTIGGVKVDINPITEGKTGTLGEYLPGVEAYLAEKRAALQEKAARRAKELLDKLAEYKPLAKTPELEECNYNMIDNVLNNEKPKEEKEKQTGRISIKEKLAEKKAVTWQRDKSVPEKGTEKKSEREI